MWPKYILLLFPSSLIHSIVTRVIKLAKSKAGAALAPSLVETYSRLLVYMEIESLGIKGFISKLSSSSPLGSAFPNETKTKEERYLVFLYMSGLFFPCP